LGLQKWLDSPADSHATLIFFLIFYKKLKIKNIRDNMGSFGYNWLN
jgi:hypothetical protein